MNPTEFHSAWNRFEQNLLQVSLQTLSRFGLNSDTVNFLSKSGLPKDAAPFLRFVGDVHADDRYSSIALLPEWFDLSEQEYNKYVVIGSDGSGDIIAVNTAENCIVEWLDHEDCFAARFMNSSIGQLASCLLCYRNFMTAINATLPDDCFDLIFSDEQFAKLRDDLKGAEPRAVLDGFWEEALRCLLAGRDEDQSTH